MTWIPLFIDLSGELSYVGMIPLASGEKWSNLKRSRISVKTYFELGLNDGVQSIADLLISRSHHCF